MPPSVALRDLHTGSGVHVGRLHVVHREREACGELD